MLSETIYIPFLLNIEMISTFIEQSDFKIKIAHSIEEIETKYNKINLLLHENFYPIEKDSYHFIGKMLKQLASKDRITNAITSILFKNIYYGELTSAGTSDVAFRFAINILKEFNSVQDFSKLNNTIAIETLNDALETIKSTLRQESKIATEADLEKIISFCCEANEPLKVAIQEALKLSGLEGKIFIENGKQTNFLVEMKEGYSFSLKPFKFMLSNNKWEANNCKVLVVDGLIEKISELDHILLQTLETKAPLVLFAHGFSEEVVATLKVNNEKGTINAQAVRIPSDVDSLNVANDIAVVCNTQPLSFMKGDMLTFKKYEDLPIVSKIRLQENKCIIENSSSRASAAEQVKMLLEKRQANFLHEEVQELFDKRIRSLTSSGAVIHLPNFSTNVLDDMRVKIDLALRQTKTIINYGTVNLVTSGQHLKDAAQNEHNDIKRAVLKAASTTFEKTRTSKINPYLSAYIGCELIAKPVLLFFISAGFVMLVD